MYCTSMVAGSTQTLLPIGRYPFCVLGYGGTPVVATLGTGLGGGGLTNMKSLRPHSLAIVPDLFFIDQGNTGHFCSPG